MTEPETPRIHEARQGGRSCGCSVALAIAVPLAVICIPFILLAMRDLSEARTVAPVPSAIVGTWRSSEGATFTFSADGSCVASHMPPLDENAWATTVQLVPSGICTWSVVTENGSIGAGSGIDIEGGGKTSTELYTRGNPAAPVLFAFIGDADEDNEYIFVKQP